MSNHPDTIDGMADEAEAELRQLVSKRWPDRTVEVDPQAGGGCLVEVREHQYRVAHWYAPRRLEAVNLALDAIRGGALD